MHMKRIMAILMLVLLGLLLISVLYFAVIGETRYLLGALFCLMVIPAVIYIFIWFTHLTKKQ